MGNRDHGRQDSHHGPENHDAPRQMMKLEAAAESDRKGAEERR